MNVNEMRKLTEQAIRLRKLEAIQEQKEKEKQKEEEEKERPSLIKKEYNRVLCKLIKVAARADREYQYDGEYSWGITYPEVLDMLEADGYKVTKKSERTEDQMCVTTADGYDFVGTGNYYDGLTALIEW